MTTALTTADVFARSREIDREVARVVFGTEILTQEQMLARAMEEWQERPNCLFFASGFRGIRPRNAAEEWFFEQEIPKYSLRPGPALLVIEALERRGMWCRIQSPFASRSRGQWCAGFSAYEPIDRLPFEAFADLMPMAVCLAALEACRS